MEDLIVVFGMHIPAMATTSKVERWEGTMRLDMPKVLVGASLCISSIHNTLLRPSCNVVLFTGDRVQGTGDATIERLSRLETLTSILASKLGPLPLLANVWVFEAPRFHGGAFACYDHFLTSLTATGDPLSYHPAGFPSSRTISSVLRLCVDKVKSEIDLGKRQEFPSLSVEKESKASAGVSVSSHNPLETVVLGFSKGGVVLNQLLAELSVRGKSYDRKANSEGTSESRIVCTPERSELCNRDDALGIERSPPTAVETLLPETGDDFLDSISEVHYIDVGLNCPGAYLTDASVLEDVVKSAASRNSRLLISFHGTPRQWMDRNRPWIVSEKDMCIAALQHACQKLNCKNLQVAEKMYYEGRPPSLRMHFEILESFVLS